MGQITDIAKNNGKDYPSCFSVEWGEDRTQTATLHLNKHVLLYESVSMGLTVSRQTAKNFNRQPSKNGKLYRQPSKKQLLLAVKWF